MTLNHTANLDNNGNPVLLGVTPSGQIRRILVDEDGALLVSGGGGGGSLALYYEGELVNSQTTKLNFKGVDVKAAQDSTDESMVNIYVPPSLYSSHFNQNDGTINALVSDITTYSRYIASPTSEGVPYKIGDWDSGTLNSCITIPTFTYKTTNQFSILDNVSTVFTVKVLDADNISIIATRDLIITGNSDTTVNNIQIQITNFVEELGKYKANINITFNMMSILPNGGRFSIYLEHNNGAEGIFTKSQNNIFYDPNNNSANITEVDISETIDGVVIKQLSGVTYYTTGSLFTLNIPSINFLNDSSYPLIQVQADASEFGVPLLNLQGAHLTNWTDLYNNINASYIKTDWEVTLNNFFKQTISAKAMVRTIDWTESPYETSGNKAIILDTFIDNSTRIYEDFRSENTRLCSNLSTPWNSQISLLIEDNGKGLQLKNSQLIYPTEDFTIYTPSTFEQPNYTTTNGIKYYYRKFYHPSLTFSNGIFTFSNHNLTETMLLEEDFNIKISINGTDWYSLSGDYLGGTLINGGSCRINSDTQNLTKNTLEFTLSTLFSSEVFIEISFSNTSLFIGSIALNWA